MNNLSEMLIYTSRVSNYRKVSGHFNHNAEVGFLDITQLSIFVTIIQLSCLVFFFHFLFYFLVDHYKPNIFYVRACRSLVILTLLTVFALMFLSFFLGIMYNVFGLIDANNWLRCLFFLCFFCVNYFSISFFFLSCFNFSI